MLFCLEKPAYRMLLARDSIHGDSGQMGRVLMVLKQFLKSGVPIVMASLMLLALGSAALSVIFYDYNALQLTVIGIALAMIATFGALVPPAIRKMEAGKLEASGDAIRSSLAPLVRLHRNGGLVVVLLLVLQLLSMVY